MTLNQITMALYATFVTNYYGFKLKFAKNNKTMNQSFCLVLLLIILPFTLSDTDQAFPMRKIF